MYHYYLIDFSFEYNCFLNLDFITSIHELNLTLYYVYVLIYVQLHCFAITFINIKLNNLLTNFGLIDWDILKIQIKISLKMAVSLE